MATKIGFQLNPNRFVFDPSKELDDFVDTVNQQEKDREAQRQKWRDEQDKFYKSANELKATPNQQANEFFGKWSGGLMSEATELQYQLENGRIDSRDYSAQFRNLLQSNEQMIGAQKNYQANAQRIVDGVADDSLSEINSMAFVEYNKALELGAIEVESDGRGGFKLFNKNTGKVYNPYQLSNLTTSNVPKFDYITATKKVVEGFGQRGIQDGAGGSVAGVYANIQSSGESLDKLLDKEAVAILSGNQARIASLLVDAQEYNVVYDEKDLVDKDGKLKEKTFLRNQDGTFTFTEADEKAATTFMREKLKNALPLVTKDAPIKTTKPTDTAKSLVIEKDQKLSYLNTINQALTGDPKESRAAIDSMIEKANQNSQSDTVLDVKRSKDGKTFTIVRQTKGETGTYETPFNIEDINSDSQPIFQIFYGNIKGSYAELLDEFNSKEGGFTPRVIKNPDYEEDDLLREKGTINAEKFIPNPNYKGASESSRTKIKEKSKLKPFRDQLFYEDQVTLDGSKDVSLMEQLQQTKKEGGIDWDINYFEDPIDTSNQMRSNITSIFSILDAEIEGFESNVKADKNGIIIEMPSVFDDKLFLSNKDKEGYEYAVEKIYNAAYKEKKINIEDLK